MAVGIYGNRKLSDVSESDVDIFYAYSPDRNTLGDTQFVPLYNSVTTNEFRKMLGADGGYKLRLPASRFNQLGFYTVLIKPKSFETTILDCSFIVTNTDQELQISKKGIIIPKLQFQSAGSLVGYQIEYFNSNGEKIRNFHRIVTSSDLVSVSSNNSSSSPNATTYYLDPNGTQLFLTLTPDEVSLITNQTSPDLGSKGQKIMVSNTFFDPTILEIEMVDQNIKTLSYVLLGNAVRDLSNGLLSIFDDAGNLYAQYNLLTRKSTFNDANLDIKERRTNINLNQNYFNTSQGI
jgi:hypothetical protein